MYDNDSSLELGLPTLDRRQSASSKMACIIRQIISVRGRSFSVNQVVGQTACMSANRLKLNADKTELLWVESRQSFKARLLSSSSTSRF